MSLDFAHPVNVQYVVAKMAKTYPAFSMDFNTISFSELRNQIGFSLEEVAEKTGYSMRTVYRWESKETLPRRTVIEQLAIYLPPALRSLQSSKPEFTFIDLFAGIGGMRIGFERAGGKCVFTSEWNKHALQTYYANFPCDHPVAGDITTVHVADIPSHDILVGGFPCQPFSIAGVSKKNALGRPHGFLDETQGTLFFDIARIIEYHRPAAFLLENVKNLVSHDKGNTFRIIRETLEKLGYSIQWKIIDARSWLPQHRERIFIVGFREDVECDFAKINIPNHDKGPVLRSILHSEDGSEEPENPYTWGSDAKVDKRYTLTTKLWEYLQAYATKHRERGNGFGFGLVTADSVARTLSARYYKDGSEILVSQKRNRPRRLTPRECSRLMGFDKFGASSFRIPVSDTQAYRQFGNAVAVPVVEAIAQYMKPSILHLRREPEQLALFSLD